MTKYLTCLLLGALLLSACYNDKKDQLYPTPTGNQCDVVNVTYAVNVGPVMAQSCALSGCHNAATGASGVVLDSYAGVKAATSGGRLVGAIRHEASFVPMPQGAPKLDDCTIAKIAAWVDAGALNN